MYWLSILINWMHSYRTQLYISLIYITDHKLLNVPNKIQKILLLPTVAISVKTHLTLKDRSLCADANGCFLRCHCDTWLHFTQRQRFRETDTLQRATADLGPEAMECERDSPSSQQHQRQILPQVLHIQQLNPLHTVAWNWLMWFNV